MSRLAPRDALSAADAGFRLHVLVSAAFFAFASLPAGFCSFVVALSLVFCSWQDGLLGLLTRRPSFGRSARFNIAEELLDLLDHFAASITLI